MKKPIIGVLPLWDDKKESIWMVPGYMKCVENAGGLPIILPMTKDKTALNQIAEEFDGFLFTGGHDVSPALYGEETIDKCWTVNETRDFEESFLYDIAVNHLDKPVLGICRGIQLINVLQGGNLYQDIPSQIPSFAESHQQSPPYDIPLHSVNITPSSPLSDLYKEDKISVNSYHHQAIKDLGSELEVMAVSPEGLIEAVYMPSKRFVWAVQWHPEFMPKSNFSALLFDRFIESITKI